MINIFNYIYLLLFIRRFNLINNDANLKLKLNQSAPELLLLSAFCCMISWDYTVGEEVVPQQVSENGGTANWFRVSLVFRWSFGIFLTFSYTEISIIFVSNIQDAFILHII